jgi:SAM-dependent methyltransferase
MKKLLQRIRFNLKYLSKPKWDTGVTAPEIIRYISGKTPGNAIDLGCGTGTNLLFLAQQGWNITGLDYPPLVIDKAKRKLSDFQKTLLVADVTKLSNYDLPGPYDMGLDMGCFHNLSEEGRLRYVEGLEKWIRSNGVFMVYAFQPHNNMNKGITKAEMITYFKDSFELINYEQGQGRPSAWYYFQKK